MNRHSGDEETGTASFADSQRLADRQFLDGGGDMGARMRAHDWSKSPLGDPAEWPQSLRSIVALMINSRYPMFIAWGPELAFLYNDGYSPIFGAKHPHMLGVPFREAWSEIWDDIVPLVDSALAGEATYHERLHLVMERNGYPEDTWYDFSYSPVRDESGDVAGMFCACTEQTQQVIAERAMAERDARLTAMFEQMSEGVIMADAEGKLTFVNRCAEQLHGVSSLMVPPEQYSETYRLFTEDGQPHPFDTLPLARAVMKAETVEEQRWRIRRPDGSEILAIGSARPIFDDSSIQIGSVLTIRDDSARHDAESALRESEARFRNMADHAPVMLWVTNPESHCTYLNRGWYEFTGQSEGEAEGMGWLDPVHPDDRDWSGETFLTANAAQAPFRLEYRLRRADGTYRWMIDAAAPRFGAGGEYLGYIGSVIEIDERKRLEALQAAQNKVLELALEADSLGRSLEALVTVIEEEAGGEMVASILLTDGEGHLILGAAPHLPDAYNQAIDGIAIGDGVGSCGTAAFSKKPVYVDDIATDPLWADFKDLAMEHGLRACWSIPILSSTDEVLGTFAMYYREPRRPSGDDLRLVEYVTRTASLIIERTRVAEALRKESEKFATLADNIPTLAWMAHADGSIFWYNRRWYEYTGTSPEAQVGWGWESVHDPATLPAVVEQWTTALAQGDTFEMTFPLRDADGDYRPFLTRAVPIRNEQGETIRWFGTNVDVRDQVEAERALTRLNETLETRVEEEVSRRNEAEEALRQAQKMEAIGQLTGGIAHDFNNLLQIITGNLDILRRGLPEDSPRLRRSVDNAAKGAERAAVLTQRLLAFSRRQPLAPKVIDPNKLVSGMSEMLHRTLGETYAIETVTGSGLWRVEADPNQLESALLNLAINGRDAMPDGGKLTLETANAHIDRDYSERHSGVLPGQYVVICVSDTGGGMDPLTAERAVEPFFTTKDVGKGTGLGLSMVYGFVKQSGGHLKIYSEPGEGTTIKIYLPRHQGPESETSGAASDEAPEGIDGETILVCEDDEDVRAYSAEVLRDLGYRVIEAADGEAALRLLDGEDGRVDLLFTDIVLPGGMTGAVVAERARQAQPGLKILFTTGYARNAIVHQGRLDPGVELLSKPFAYADLAARVRDLLDAPALD